MPASVQDIARKAGVSVATVSRALNNLPHVKPELKQRVLEAAKELKYAPPATSLCSNKMPLIVDSLRGRDREMGFYENQLIGLIGRNLSDTASFLEMISIDDLLRFDLMYSRVAISISYWPQSEELLKSLKLPLITINNPREGAFNVRSDHYAGGREAAELLLSLGHRRIGVCMSYGGSWGSLERLKGCKDALAKAGVAFDERLIATDKEDISFLRPLAEMMKLSPTALICMGEDFTLPVNSALHLLGRKVPEDVSIVGFEEERIAKYSIPPLTTVAQPFKEMVALAVKEAVEVAKGKDFKPGDAILPNKIVARDSTRPPKAL